MMHLFKNTYHLNKLFKVAFVVYSTQLDMFPQFASSDFEMREIMPLISSDAKQFNLDRYSSSIIVMGSDPSTGAPYYSIRRWFTDALPNVIGFRLLDVHKLKMQSSTPSSTSVYLILSDILASKTNGSYSSSRGKRMPIIGILPAAADPGVPDFYPTAKFPTFWFRNPCDISEIDMTIRPDFGEMTPIGIIPGPITFTLELFHTLGS